MKRFFLVLIIVLLSDLIFCWEKGTKIAILEFINKDKTSQIDTKLITDLLEKEFIKDEYYIVLDRKNISNVLQEKGLALSLLVDSDIIEIGENIDADKVISGSISKIDNIYILIIKLYDIYSAKIELIENYRMEKVELIIERIPDIAKSIISKSKSLYINDNLTEEERITEKLIKDTKKKLFLDESKNTIQENTTPKEDNTNYYRPLKSNALSFLQITFTDKLQLFPKDVSIYGMAFNIISGYNVEIFGVQIGPFADNHKMIGFQMGLIINSDEIYGLQAHFIGKNFTMGGIQIGLINISEKIYGGQIGIINYTKYLYGIQIGLLNFIENNGLLPFMIGVNIGF